MFESCYELKEAFDRLLKRPDKLTLVTGEVFPTQRLLDDEVDGTEMEGVEHLGQYVYEMTQAKIASLKAGNSIPDVLETVVEPQDSDLEMDEAEEEEVNHEDDLEGIE